MTEGKGERGLGARGETRRGKGRCQFLSDFLSPLSPKGLVLTFTRAAAHFFPTDSLSVQKAHCAKQSPIAPDILSVNGSLRYHSAKCLPTFVGLAARCARIAPFALSGNRPFAQAGAPPACDNRRCRGSISRNRPTGNRPRVRQRTPTRPFSRNRPTGYRPAAPYAINHAHIAACNSPARVL